MFNWRSHPDEGQLLRFSEGELPAGDASAIEDHIRGCWECRTNIDDMRRIVGDYIHYRSDVLRAMIPPPPAPWMPLSREFQRIRSEPSDTGRSFVFRRPLIWILAGLATLAATAAAIVFIKPDSPPPPLSEIYEQKPAEAVEAHAPQPTPNRGVLSSKRTVFPGERVGPEDELKVIAALHRIGADLGDPVEVTRKRDEIVLRGAGLEPERVAQLRASVAALPHLSLEFDVPAPPAERASRTVMESGRSSPVQAELARQLADRVDLQKIADQTLEASEEILARAHALQGLAHRFPPNVESQMSASAVTLLSLIRNEHVAALTKSAEGLNSTVTSVLRSLGANANEAPQNPTAANWQVLTDQLLSTAERVDQLVGTMFATTTGTALDGLSASEFGVQLAGAQSEMEAEVVSLNRLSSHDKTRGVR